MTLSQGPLHTDLFFRDSSGRALLLRGVNLTASKTPRSTPSHCDPFDAAESGQISFINTPLCLEDGTADVHLARLRGYGFTVLRYVVCWEAIEHAGPCVTLSDTLFTALNAISLYIEAENMTWNLLTIRSRC